MRQDTANLIDKFTTGFGLSLAITILLNAFLVVLKETYPAVRSWMSDVTGNHWITHAFIIISIYVTLGIILSYAKIVRNVSPQTLLITLITTVFTGCIVIIGYYLTRI
ncbi:MAG: hypothetical protein ACYC27_12430 [Armatimonadota bacterium]